MAQPGYLRHPTIRDDTIVFICDDDLWRVGANGGLTGYGGGLARKQWLLEFERGTRQPTLI